MSEEMEIQKRINELVEEKTRRELAERTQEEKEFFDNKRFKQMQ